MFFGRTKYSYLNLVTLYIKLVPGMAIAKIMYYLFCATIPTLTIFLTTLLINNSLDFVQGNTALNQVLIPIMGIIGIRVFQYFVGVFFRLVGIRASNKVSSLVLPQIAERKACVKYRYYEDQDSIDTMNRAMDGFASRPQDFFDHFFMIFVVVVQIIGFVVVLGIQLWWASIVFVLMAIPAFIVSYRFGERKYDIDKKMSKVDRRAWYISDVLKNREYVDERYLFQYTDEMDNKYRKDYERARNARKNVTFHVWADTTLAGSLVFISGIITVGALMFNLASVGSNTGFQIGLFVSLVNALFGLSREMQETIPNYINKLKYQLEYLKDLNNFLLFEMEESAACQPNKRFCNLESIEFRDVSFRYPNCTPYILKNFNLKLVAGKHYAVVGVNGAGKTTIVKLLTGLYDEYSGEILINGEELRNISLPDRKALVSVIYQDFCKYPLDFYQNIAIGNVFKMKDKKMVENAALLMGLQNVIEKLPEGLQTPVSKIYENGVDLSGGEWQKIALSRLYISDAPVKILDEPTSALDPVSESNLYSLFYRTIESTSRNGSITLFISHRLGSTKLADEIVVIDHGQVAEIGTFDELLSRESLFAEMYKKQSQWYCKRGKQTYENEKPK
ncbi:MAG: ABC transporter ATP-binding protein [Eubacteriales bacterium]